MMKNTLKELWYGNLFPRENIRITNDEYKAVSKQFYERQANLESKLPKETFGEIEELLGLAADMSSHFEAEAFCTGFRLGSKMMFDILDQKD